MIKYVIHNKIKWFIVGVFSALVEGNWTYSLQEVKNLNQKASSVVTFEGVH